MQLEQFLAYGTYARVNEMQACRIAQEDMTDISLVTSYAWCPAIAAMGRALKESL